MPVHRLWLHCKKPRTASQTPPVGWSAADPTRGRGWPEFFDSERFWCVFCVKWYNQDTVRGDTRCQPLIWMLYRPSLIACICASSKSRVMPTRPRGFSRYLLMIYATRWGGSWSRSAIWVTVNKYIFQNLTNKKQVLSQGMSHGQTVFGARSEKNLQEISRSGE